MKLTKTIATICAIGMVVSTMAMPVQAKTSSKVETEIITMDDAPTTTTKNKTKKTTKKATDEYKDFGKDLKVTVHTYDDFVQAYLYANMMCAKSLKITFANDYKMWCNNARNECGTLVSMLEQNTSMGYRAYYGGMESDKKTVTLKDFGDVMAHFTYAYKTGDTQYILKEYKDLYALLSKGIDSCTSNADSIEAVADNVCKWLEDNTVPTSKAIFGGKWGVSKMEYTADGKMRLNCMGYSYVFTTMMRMSGYTSWIVQGLQRGGRHAWNAIKVDDEYRYYDAAWSRVGTTYMGMTFKEMKKTGYEPEMWHLVKGQTSSDKNKAPTQKELEACFVDWH